MRIRTACWVAIAAALLPTAPPAAASSTACANADLKIRTPRWYTVNRPDLTAAQVSAIIARDESLAMTAITCLVNAERVAARIGALTHHNTLYVAANQHVLAARQLKWWKGGADPHVNPQTRSTPATRAKAAGWCPSGSWTIYENVYQGWGDASATPRAAVRWWMGSPGHRATILRAALKYTGVSVRQGTAQPGITSDTAMITAQVFGTCA